MTLDAICHACGGQMHGNNADNRREVTQVVIDSRLIEQDGLFIATRGERVDGHSFIGQVFDKGAMAVVCEEVPENPAGPCILVEDSFKALRDIASYYREQLDIPVVGITGSVGKTTTKEFVASVLSTRYDVCYTQGNFNNEVGMPLTLLRTRDNHQVLVLEMGINHFGEMDRLSSISRPDIMLITNIGQCHLEYLGDRDGVLRAKTECFRHLSDGAKVILNGDDDKLSTVSQVQGRKPVFIGRDTDRDYKADILEDLGLLGTRVSISSKITGDTIQAVIPLPGDHMVYNAMSAMAVGEALGVSSTDIVKGIEQIKATGGRSNVIKASHYTLIDDCYNANPTSMKAALELLCRAKGRKVAIMGDMFELGGDEATLHREVGTAAAGMDIDGYVCIGSLSRHMYDAIAAVDSRACEYYKTVEDFLNADSSLIRDGDSILIKASHSMGFSKIVEKFNN